MKKGEYRARIADSLLKDILLCKGAVLVEGPKWCGKTTTAARQAASVLYMDEPGKKDSNVALAKLNPSRLLSGEHPRLIDEWQLAPSLWGDVRFYVDRASEYGQYILTGSSVPPKTDEMNHTGTGRIARFRMRPMSLWESGESSGSVSLGDLFTGKTMETADAKELGLEGTAYAICRGGWPEAVGQSERFALRHAFDYVDAVVESDISRFDGVARDAECARTIMRSYARLQGTQAGIGVITADLSAHEGRAFGENTIYSYLNALRGIFVVDDVSAWHPNLRRKTTVRASDTRYFADPSIATAALGLGPDALHDDLPTFGMLVETLAMRDMRAYADALDGTVHHYLDRNGLECDAVIRLRDGRFGLVEVKLGGEALIEKGCETLLKLSSAIDTSRMREPSFKMILTAVGDFAYRRPADGVIVCPISALKP
ncbi:MAG: ATP-binding protein [Kiritimatiellae bacterium]|nr:ATP-binding protein [Kiritimatiellia bacterium]MBQ3343151.1 ATP-binding protein [Kiritimatiellia bacterium]